MDKIKLIVPEEKDKERAKGLTQKSSAQVEGIFRLIKDVNKCMRRAVAYANLTSWGYQSLRKRLLELNPTPEQLEAYDASIKKIEDDRTAKFKANQEAKRLAFKPIKDFMDEKVGAKILKFSAAKLHNQLGLRKGVFGDELKVKNFEYDLNHYAGWGRTIPVRVIARTNYLDGYFFKDCEYSLVLESHIDHNGLMTFNRDPRGFAPSVRLGKKDTATLLELIKNKK